MKSECRKSWPLMLSFLVFSMVLNCVGVVILQLSRSQIPYEKLGVLEAFKDLPIAATSFLAARYISRFGSRLALSASLFAIAFSAGFLPFLSAFWFLKIWFVTVGISFSIGKIAVYGIIKNNFRGADSLSRVMGRTEASFMAGIFLVNTVFGWLVSSAYASSWKLGFLAIGLLSCVVGVLVLRTNYLEVSPGLGESVFHRLSKIINTASAPYFLVIFFIVFAEQGFNVWLPSFFKNNLRIGSYVALQASAFLALFSFAGRILAARFSSKFSTLKFISGALYFILAILFACQMIINGFSSYSKILLVLFPLAGFFCAPLYPIFNARLLNETDGENMNVLASTVVIISSLGSSCGSLATAALFDIVGSNYLAGFLWMIFGCILFFTMILRKKLIINRELR